MVSSTATQIADLIGLARDEIAVGRIDKFVRCNGDAGLIDAARETRSQLDQRPGAVADAWHYTISVYNGNAARAAALYPLLFLLENGIRVRVDSLLADQHGPAWFATPERYATRSLADALRSGDRFRAVQERIGDARGIRRFASGAEFCQALPFSGLRDLVLDNPGLTKHAFSARIGIAPIHPQRLRSALKELVDCRNDVAHHRGIRVNLFEDARKTCTEFLERLDFDVAKAGDRILTKVHEVHNHSVRQI